MVTAHSTPAAENREAIVASTRRELSAREDPRRRESVDELSKMASDKVKRNELLELFGSH